MTNQVSVKLRSGEVADFASLVASYSSDELASPSRSTVPLLAFWARPQARFRELGTSLALDTTGPLEFGFEYPVPVQKGSGKASFTDLMVTGRSFVVAIEAKYKEPPYQTVASWLGDPAPENRQAVLEGWLGLIGDTTRVTLAADQIANLPYQLIHRAASACYPKAPKSWVLYQLFSGELADYYRAHLSALSHALGDQVALRFGILLSPFEPSAELTHLKNAWSRGTRDLSSSVRSGLLSDSLFKFTRAELTNVSAGNG